ncbi:hypothetical protein LTR62_003471 [Meristemomyces frigidus]|uniref:Uncharacterized protein n=1 Tax=Meristemomyces frigidus TaxID=1508187 RepID=A0AAN7TII9_9PEZI|nr:hypothetical protein LTR62_003471 [Meristemomyces frigidus]
MVRPPPTLLIPLAAFLVYTTITLHRLLSSPYPITTSPTAPTSLTTHPTLLSLINPLNLPAEFKTQAVRIPRPTAQDGSRPSNDHLLLRFTHGFFGGTVLAPERRILNLVRPTGRLRIAALDDLPVAPKEIWTRDDLSTAHLPDLGTKLFGSWQVVDRFAPGPRFLRDTSRGAELGESYITFAFGQDRGLFMGVLRFYVSEVPPESSGDREDNREGSETAWVELRLCSMSIVTSENGLVRKSVKWLGGLHGIYAKLLFRDAIGEVFRNRV